MGICAMETLLQSFTGYKIPLASPAGKCPCAGQSQNPARNRKAGLHPGGCRSLPRRCSDECVMMFSVERIPYGSWSCKTRPAKAKCRARNQTYPPGARPLVNAPDTTTILNVEPGSIRSLMTRLRRASRAKPRDCSDQIRQRHHRQNLARAGTGDDGGDADGRVFLQRVGQRGFHDVLDRASMVSTTFRPSRACTSSSRNATSSRF